MIKLGRFYCSETIATNVLHYTYWSLGRKPLHYISSPLGGAIIFLLSFWWYLSRPVDIWILLYQQRYLQNRLFLKVGKYPPQTTPLYSPNLILGWTPPCTITKESFSKTSYSFNSSSSTYNPNIIEISLHTILLVDLKSNNMFTGRLYTFPTSSTSVPRFQLKSWFYRRTLFP